jgi:acyl-coenzyme A thioesterase PaaI-like protein
VHRRSERNRTITTEHTPSGAGNIPRWTFPSSADPDTADAYAELIGQLRLLQDAVVGAHPPVADSKAAADLLAQATALLARSQTDEAGQISGKLFDVPSRAQPLIPAMHYDVTGPDSISGTVTYGRYFLGGGGAAHGGSLPLLFDEAFGLLAGSGGRPLCRTAYLKVNYRKITPLDRELRFTGAVEKSEGRKLFVSGTLTDGEDLLADAEALFVALKPGQP